MSINVAKSYQDWEKVSEPFEKNGKNYIVVINPKNQKEKEVRVYNDAEYARMYGSTTDKPIPFIEASQIRCTQQKKVLGFEKGYITIFKGDVDKYQEWFSLSNARYARLWGWYIVSTEELPKDLPHELTPIKLPWEAVGDEDGTLKIDRLVLGAVDKYLYGDNDTKFVGQIGERLELQIKIISAILNNPNKNNSDSPQKYRSNSMLYIMQDEEENTYIWNSYSKTKWDTGQFLHIRGTVKAHKRYHNQCQTVLTRCIEVK